MTDMVMSSRRGVDQLGQPAMTSHGRGAEAAHPRQPLPGATALTPPPHPHALAAHNLPPSNPNPHPSPESPVARITRKRTASLVAEDSHRPPSIEHLSLETGNPARPALRSADSTRDLICLCTQPPKVPRPRNAFILYRQHHQGQVALNNPGLANPEISKIIGELWREESEERKNDWKRLAEQEKQRHQQQYPDYRYQPRRGGKGVSVRPTSASGEDPGRCAKCGGRFIATPRTPSTPLLTPVVAKAPMPSYNTPYSRGTEAEYHRHSPQGSMNQHAELGRGRAFYGPALPSRDEHEPLSPTEVKKRRFNPSYPSPYGPPHLSSYPGDQRPHSRAPYPGISPPTPGYVQTGPLPGPSDLARDTPVMAPPPRPAPTYQPSMPRGLGFDESLRLPPLQTQMPSSPRSTVHVAGEPSASGSGPNALQPIGVRESPSTNIEALIMSIPYLNKLKVLEKISPPLPPPGQEGLGAESRGPVIAIEGPNPTLLKQVASTVERALAASGECAVRAWSSGASAASGGFEELAGAHEKSSRSGSLASTSSHGPWAANPFGPYLSMILDWQIKSNEIVKHVTNRPRLGRTSDASTASEGQKSDSSTNSNQTNESGPTASLRGSTQTQTQQPPSAQQLHYTSRSTPLMPVALLPSGFSLTISDHFASTVPIHDAYAPVDHWQWMATLWRGIIGPDLVIYVRATDEAEMMMNQAVELQGSGIMTVRVTEGSDVSEKTERRLGFEVLEWVRGVNLKEGLGSGPQ